MRPVIVGVGRYRRGVEVDAAQSSLIRAMGTLTADAVALLRAMHGRASEDPSDFLWVALASPLKEELTALGGVFRIPQLWVDDALNPHQRAKAEFSPDGGSAIIVFKIISYFEETSAIETGQIALLVGESFVITIRLGPVGALGRVRSAATTRPEFLALGPLSAVHGIIDAIVDDYVAAVDEISRDLDSLEERVFDPAATDDPADIYRLKRENLELRRAVAPLVPLAHRLVEGTLEAIPPSLRPHYRDVGDHLLRAHDGAEGHESLLMTMLAASNARQGLQQNTDMRKMAAYAALLAVPTALAGIYGMNFEHMPELRWKFGYPVVLVVMAGVLVLMYRAFKRSGWL
jgi:magnesium transporter